MTPPNWRRCSGSARKFDSSQEFPTSADEHYQRAADWLKARLDPTCEHHWLPPARGLYDQCWVCEKCGTERLDPPTQNLKTLEGCYYWDEDWVAPAVERSEDEIIEIDENGVVHAKPETLRQLKGAKLRDPGPRARGVAAHPYDPDDQSGVFDYERMKAGEASAEAGRTRPARDVIADLRSVETDEARDAEEVRAISNMIQTGRILNKSVEGTARTIRDWLDASRAALSRSVPGDTET